MQGSKDSFIFFINGRRQLATRVFSRCYQPDLHLIDRTKLSSCLNLEPPDLKKRKEKKMQENRNIVAASVEKIARTASPDNWKKAWTNTVRPKASDMVPMGQN